VALNLAFNALFMFLLPGPQRYLGIALSTTLVSVCYAASLFWSLRRKVGHLGALGVAKDSMKCLAAAAVMGLGVWMGRQALAGWAGWSALPGRLALGLQVGLLLTLGASAYFGLTRLLGLKGWEPWQRS
jgi:peptidoglycan biosynthesis protein MviN/MurJ (putative lipid II flippase)